MSAPPPGQPGRQFGGMRVHFVGVGGVGMSGLAHCLIDAGATVTGSDPTPSELTEKLADRGCRVNAVQDGSAVTPGLDLVVRTAAVEDHNGEVAAAHALGVEVIRYAELLGEVMATRAGVAVAGTHGKTTTTAMLAHALVRGGHAPSFVVGGHVPQLGGGSQSGRGDLFVAEACEYARSFLHLRPQVAVVTNVEADHLDTYPGGLPEIVDAFCEFAAGVPEDGRVILNGDDPNSARIFEENAAKAWRVGTTLGCEWTLVPAGLNDHGCPVGHLLHGGRRAATLSLSVPGSHNLANAAAAVVAAVAVGGDVEQSAAAVSDFRGVDRRQTLVGRAAGGQAVLDDYAHHPTEIRTTLAALRQRYAPRRVICVFQPHQASRTRHLLDDFATSFAAADLLFIPDIYSVRDTIDDRRFVSSGTLAERVRGAGQHAEHVPTFDAVATRVRGELREGDLVVTMGAGDVWRVGRMLVQITEAAAA